MKEYYEAGQEREIVFRLGKDELGYFDNHMTYLVEPGKFKVWVGGDCYAKDEIEIVIV